MRVPRRIVFLSLSLVAMVAILLAACAPPAPTPTPVPPPPKPTAAPPAKPAEAPAPKPTAAPAAKPTAAPTKPAPPAATPAPKAAAPAKTTKLKFGTMGFVSDAGVFIALEKGYFKEQGLDVEWELISGANYFQLLATEGLQVGGATTDAGLFNSILRGVNLKMVADKATNVKGTRFTGLVVRKDLADQIKTPADLKGRAVANLCENCQEDYKLELWLKDGGLTLSDVKYVSLPNPADHLPALANKSVDVAQMVEPFVTISVDQGVGAPWLFISDRDPGMQGAVLLFSEGFAKDVDAARRFMVANIKGVREYLDAFNKGKNKADVVNILTKYTTLKDPKMYDKVGLPGLNPDGKINVANVAAQQDFFVRKGVLKEKLDLSKVIDMQFVDYAVQRLGPYN
ncbi:MAG: ABC transporter substrate-binding protein [Chloroflexi bacterium]|nr:ABC transporter substrate-binding protein [Chloroflexota bacterium]